jgi:hypothetical protein
VKVLGLLLPLTLFLSSTGFARNRLACYEAPDGGQASTCIPGPSNEGTGGGGAGSNPNACHPYTIVRCTDRVEGPFPPKIIRECTTEVKTCN